jgi:hypothetical protein
MNVGAMQYGDMHTNHVVIAHIHVHTNNKRMLRMLAPHRNNGTHV